MELIDYSYSAGLLTLPQTSAFSITDFICGSPLQLYVTEESHISEFGTTHKLEIKKILWFILPQFAEGVDQLNLFQKIKFLLLSIFVFQVNVLVILMASLHVQYSFEPLSDIP